MRRLFGDTEGADAMSDDENDQNGNGMVDIDYGDY